LKYKTKYEKIIIINNYTPFKPFRLFRPLKLFIMPESARKFNPENNYVAKLSTEMAEPKIEEDELEIIKKAQAGDRKAWKELIKKYEKRLRSFINRDTNGSLNQHDMDDIYQNTWKRVFEKIDLFHGGKFHSWIFTIAHRTFLNEIKRTKKSAITPNFKEDVLNEQIDPKSDPDYSNTSQTEEGAETSQIAEKLNQAMAILNEKEREVVLLRAHDEDFNEISKKTGDKIPALTTRYHRAKIKMMKVLEKLGLNSNYFKK